MDLTLDRKDALTELINIGYGRAAGALSELTGYRIALEVPRVAIYEIDLIPAMVEDLLGPSVASVTQPFTGPVSGNALLLLAEPSALVLGGLLSEVGFEPRSFDSNAREISTEVGNILLNACLGVLGSLLRLQVNFAVPHMRLERSARLIEVLAAAAEEKLTHCLMIDTKFKVREGSVTGYVVIALGRNSFDRLMLELGAWESRPWR